jgi:outer membrane protein
MTSRWPWAGLLLLVFAGYSAGEDQKAKDKQEDGCQRVTAARLRVADEKDQPVRSAIRLYPDDDRPALAFYPGSGWIPVPCCRDADQLVAAPEGSEFVRSRPYRCFDLVANAETVLAVRRAVFVALQSGSPRVAIVDMARVSAESALGKGYASQLEKLQTEIQTSVTLKSTELQKLDAAVRALEDELEKQGSVLSQEARDKNQQEIRRRSRERRAFLEDGQAEINRMRELASRQAESINNEFQTRVRPLVEQVAKEKGYDLVLDAQVAFAINKEFDITRDVIVKADDMTRGSKP